MWRAFLCLRKGRRMPMTWSPVLASVCMRVASAARPDANASPYFAFSRDCEFFFECGSCRVAASWVIVACLSACPPLFLRMWMRDVWALSRRQFRLLLSWVLRLHGLLLSRISSYHLIIFYGSIVPISLRYSMTMDDVFSMFLVFVGCFFYFGSYFRKKVFKFSYSTLLSSCPCFMKESIFVLNSWIVFSFSGASFLVFQVLFDLCMNFSMYQM